MLCLELNEHHLCMPRRSTGRVIGHYTSEHSRVQVKAQRITMQASLVPVGTLNVTNLVQFFSPRANLHHVAAIHEKQFMILHSSTMVQALHTCKLG